MKARFYTVIFKNSMYNKDNIRIRCPGGLMVMIEPCHGSEPGSIPGQGVLYSII